MSETVQHSSALLVHFILTLEDGSAAESTRERGKPALFRLGDGSLSDALEQHLLGLRRGDKRKFTLPPESAFGPTNPNLIQFFLRRDFAQTGVPDVGTIMLFSGVAGNDMPGIIRDVTEESVTVDFNHPLSGQAITFDLEVLDIDPVQQEASHADSAG
ncbi:MULTISPECIES: FKBP-type peptidyl-prolyl cis-trans isomerase [Pectobacterium]|uniref:FKBP-type peptidyl-prolyl cis-trans isomerase n=1 Tax=Pectobacterium TaxID=122277 RepID=UPI001BFF7DC9|nr:MULTISPECIES: FKBP-type peptidyl-prolyl cis-trans isomerase [Pectobacterium]MBT9183620.1 FKBP-type peptidyl-prolyl cis-trans isomerase [Pectobacterium punjabense]MCE9733435.1 peptidylprolyl isomerase [Pectobacterium sp. IFB5596]MDG0797189.1 FKBP-type peptidyl-prolyl cis-trans isomerase [Pectobacterium punjabense]GKW12061.1 peptidyl-prolyl cis-trans isomerase [Pectobacterium carotovorum subsp. carotovorum]